MMRLPPQASVAVAVRLIAAPIGPVHSAVKVDEGHTSIGGFVSATVTVIEAVLDSPARSVTINVRACGPRGRVTFSVSPVPSVRCAGRPWFSNHSYDAISSFVPGLESESLDADPSSVTAPPLGRSHSTVDAALARAYGA